MHLKTLFETNKNGKKGKGNKIGIGRKCEYVIKKHQFLSFLKETCLVTLFDLKLKFFKNRQNGPFSGIFSIKSDLSGNTA